MKRLNSYAKIELIEIQDIKLTSTNSIEIVKEKEAKIIEKHLDNRSFLVVLDLNGKQMSSENFAAFLKKSNKNITFLVGGVYGIAENLLERADLRLSFSKMTFTHQIIRLILLEQIYRAFTIINGKKYHY
ncbi:MAG: hypothetical protein APR54_03715 [Candidatus Cloacimonas sp. SDB]|nr:MAG: hypothetical protein APR54_03715 [Candidatus Cloacimonas sp. SDB]